MINIQKQKEIIEVFKFFLVTFNNYKLYGAQHRQTKLAINDYITTMQATLTASESANFDYVGEQWLILGRPVTEIKNTTGTLIEAYEKNKISRLAIYRHIDYKSMIELFEHLIEGTILTSDSSSYDVYTIIPQADIEPPFGMDTRLLNIKGNRITEYLTEQITTEHASYQDLISIYSSYNRSGSFDTERGKSMSSAFIYAFKSLNNPLKYLADVKTDDEYTFVHTINVALLSLGIGLRIGIKGERLNQLIFSALLHDIGKMMVPNEILNKPGKLTEEEFKIMQSHPVLGARYIAKHNDMPKVTVLAALEHHIKFNGEGYPYIGEKWKPHIVSQIISVADIFDALRSNRPYRKAMSDDKILHIMRSESGVGLNPEIVDLFIKLINQD